LTDETRVVATVAVEEEEDFSDLIIIKQHENNETSLENIKNLNLKEMVKEMATFDWPQLTNNSQTPTDNINNKGNKETTQILEINVEKTEPIKTAAVVATTTKSSLSSSSRYRSTSASRSIHCSGGFITTPDNLRRRKRFLKVKKKYCSAHGSRDMSSLTISGNNNNNNNTTNNTSLLLNLSKNSFNVRSRSSSVKIINILGKEIIKLPLCLEREIKIKKEFKTLGISLVDSNVDEGVNGCCIVKIEKNSACFNDARLQVGDYLIAINNEHLRNVSNSSARAILNRATLTSSEYLLVVFIPLNDALQYVEQFNKIHGSSFKLSNSSKNISSILSTAAIKTKNGRKIEKTLKKISKLKSPSSTSVSSTRSSSSNSSISSIDSSSSSSSSLSSTCSCSNNKKHLNLSKFSLSLDISKKSTNHSKTGNNNNNNTNNSKNLTKSLQSIENMNNTIQTSKSKDNITTINNNNNNNKETDVWGPIRTIVLERAQNNTSLGISIVGGKFELNNNAQPMNGIFIKHVSDKSVASQNGQIKIGDRIISVNDFDLTNVTHEKAVEIIRSALSPVKFVIQSLISSSSLSSKSDDDLDNNHNDQNNKYQYSLKMINKKYAFLLDPDSSNTTNNKLYIFRIKRTNLTESLGLGLTGNSDPNKTSVFVCNIYKDSVAEQHDLFKVGDQILEINGHCVYGRSHSNVTPLIRSIKELEIYFIVLRNKDYLNEMFIPSNKEPNNNETIIISDPTPLSSIPTATTTNEENKEIQLKRVTFDKPCKQVKLSKGVTGFGIAICEDRFHRLIVRGLNPNGVAYQDGRIEIGDEIIAINDVKISSLNYDEIMNKLHTTLEPVEFTLIKPERLATTTTEDSSPSKLNTPVKQAPIQQEAAASPPLPPPPLSPQTQTKSPIKQSSIIKKTTTTTTNSNDPKTNKIKMGEETLIEIERGKLGLGLSIVGGFDTQLPGIIIHDIYQNGAAFLDKRLTIGDQILKVNNIDLTNATHEQALNALRQTSDSVRLLIHRGFINTNQSIIPPTSTDTCSVNTFGVRLKSNNEDININKYLDGVSNYEDEKLLNILSIDLNKKFAKGLGFSIIGRRTGGSTDGSGVFISHIVSII
jgi:C-terminal processing protease CtpA/Prc